MALFQKAPSTQEEYEQYKPLDITPEEVLNMDEDEWYEKVYRGESFPQLTIRAVLMGSALGFLLAFTNLYIGLKTGWALGVAITACIVSYVVWNIFLKIGWAKTPMTILETNCMQSTASAAGYSTGGTMVSAISALLMLSATEANPEGQHIPLMALVLWTLFLAGLGTVLAIPMKRNMINQEKLKFPSGTAAAVTLQSLYSEGTEAVKKAYALMIAGLVGLIVPPLIDLNIIRTEVTRDDGTTWNEGEPLLPASSNTFDLLPARGKHLDAESGQMIQNEPSDWAMVLDHNPVMIAAGALVGLRIAIYMMLGSLALNYFVGPPALTDSWTAPNEKVIMAATLPATAWKEVGLWLGVAIMVSSGILAFLLQWKTIIRAFTGFGGQSGSDSNEAVRSSTEAPGSWFIIGTVVMGTGVILIANHYFEVPYHYGVLAVLLTFLLSLVACRATGESDITPVGAMGKIMQLTFGKLIPQSTTANLMTASITASSAGSSADLLNDLKSGYLLGANPRRQFVAQFMGIFAGTAATVWGFRMLVPTADKLGGTEFPAPAAVAWKAIADVFKNGFENMHPTHVQMIGWGLGLGAVMVLMETAAEKMGHKKMKKWLPSATGIGLGLILPFQYPLSMLIGAVAAYVWTKSNKKVADTYVVPIAAGIIAGVSIMGVIVALVNGVFLDAYPVN
ncbi:MAG: OPT/YSL family transporter [Planctomycetes bacterium]|nr:OPT/YSL family transporter [Planctomycetota bacterium]